MPDPCRSMRESKRKKEDDIRLLLKKKMVLFTKDGNKNKDVEDDIYAAEQAIKQLKIDIKACMEKNKKTKATKSKQAEKPGVKAKTSQTSESLETSYNEPSHGTGYRKQIV